MRMLCKATRRAERPACGELARLAVSPEAPARGGVRYTVGKEVFLMGQELPGRISGLCPSGRQAKEPGFLYSGVLHMLTRADTGIPSHGALSSGASQNMLVAGPCASLDAAPGEAA